MNWTSFWLPLTLIPALAVGAFTRASAADAPHSQVRTWKTVDELSAEELREVDLAAGTPRHAQVPYLPAEPYPFAAPYSAEEMGYRVMEFTQRPRWSCVFANVWGSISGQGVLLSPGKSVTFMDYPEPVGVSAEFVHKPGEELYRYLNQNIFPPDAEGSQRMTIRYRTDHDFVKKEEGFMYSPSIRRVRHQVPFRRQDKFPNQAQTLDDATDIMSYMVRDNHRVKQWSVKEQEIFFSPDFMRRQWYLDTSVKSQAEVAQPEQFFLRPPLEASRFPGERPMQIPAAVVARVQAQEAAGRLVFEVEKTPPVMSVAAQPMPAPVTEPAEGGTAPNAETPGAYVQRPVQGAATALR